jgi:hypothetical protein
MTSEKRILNEGLVLVSALPGVMAWRNNSGQAWQANRVERRPGGVVILYEARPVQFGLPGSGDILGCAPGFAFALEAKTDTGRQSEQQKKFQAAFERAGGRYGLFRSPR